MSRSKMIINSLEIDFITKGNINNEVIVFFHGLGSNLEQWYNQIEYFKKDYYVVAFSLQGHGLSSKPKESKNYSISAYMKTIELVLKELNIERFYWIGNSMGGVLGYEYIRRYPNKIKILITNGTTPRLRIPKLILKLIISLDKMFLKLNKLDGYVKFACKHGTRSKKVRKQLFDIMIQMDPNAIISSHQLLGNYSYLDDIDKTDVPIIIIENHLDILLSVLIMKFRKKITRNKNIEIIELEKTGHLANLERPLEYNYIINKLLQKHKLV